jgi:type IV secretion system protein VirB3
VREAIYKGATRPAMKWGVPLMALVAIFMPTIVLGVWGAALVSPWIFPCVVVVLAPLYGWMRYVTAKDDQRLIQMILRFKLARLNPNRRLWKARSYSPHRMRKPQDVRF